MAPNKNNSSSSSSCGLTRLLTIIGVLIGVFTPIVYLVERNLESISVFKTDELHDLALRGIKEHGNDTAKIVEYIVNELHENHPSHVNPNWNDRDEWVFNNAGGAMGGMYIIHASMSFPLFPRIGFLCSHTYIVHASP